MSTPAWLDALPENITEAEYRGLSEEVSRSIENEIGEIREFHMDATAVSYRLHAVHTSVLVLEQPIRLALPISDLVSG